MTDLKETIQRCWVIAAFGDIRGFGAWAYRASNSLESQKPLIQKFYRCMENFQVSKYLGDGFMVIQEMSPLQQKDREVLRFLREIKLLTQEMQGVLKTSEVPIDGFRVRIMGGYVWKVLVREVKDRRSYKRTWEYVGYATNTAQRLLSVEPETICLIHENLLKYLTEKDQEVMEIKKFRTPTNIPIGVNSEDLEGLWEMII